MSSQQPDPHDDAPWYDANWGLIAAVSFLFVLITVGVLAIVILGWPPRLARSPIDGQSAALAEGKPTATELSDAFSATPSSPLPTQTPTEPAPTLTPTPSPTQTPQPTTGSTPTPANTPVPTDVQALLDEGENLFYTYQYAAADDHFSQMIASDPDNVDALLWRARERLHVGSDDNVLADVTHAMELDPDNVDALLIFADWAAAHDDYLTAMAYLQMALALEPDNADVYNGFGGFYSNLDQYEEAVTYYTKALELDPNRPLIYNNRGAAFSWLRQDDLALANYARALELDPNHGVAMVNRAILELRHGDVEASLQDIEAAEQLRPRDPRVYELIGYFYARKYGDYEAAAEAYTTSIELAPQINPPYGARCNVYGNLGRFEEAMADCQYLIEHMTNDIHVYDHLGHLYLQMGDWQGGYDTFDKIIQLGGYPHAYWHRGYSSYRLGNYAEALDDINLALSMVDYSGYHYDRGLVYFRTGRVEEGFDELSTTFRISSIYLDSLTLDFPYRTSPESDIMNYLGWGKYYEALGKSGQARENYEAFLEAYGTNDDLYEAVEARIQVLQ